jgi:P27 family predicted phage terminase small subunit
MAKNSKYKHTTNQHKKLVGTFHQTRHGDAIAEEIIKSKDLIASENQILLSSKKFNTEQLELFNDIIQLLERSGTLQKVGLRFVEIFCIQYKHFQDAEENIEKFGTTIVIPMKYGDTTKKNPAVDVQIGAYNIMMDIAGKFGFHPLAQSKIHLNGGNEKAKEGGFASRF